MKVSSSWTAIALSAMLIGRCGVIAHPVSKDGNDTTNPVASNPGKQVLRLWADSTSIAVGSGVQIHISLGTTTLSNSSAQVTVQSSDSTKVLCCAFAASVGKSTLTYFYNAQQASIDIAVYKNPVTGASGFIDALTDRNSGASSTRFPAHHPTSPLQTGRARTR